MNRIRAVSAVVLTFAALGCSSNTTPMSMGGADAGMDGMTMTGDKPSSEPIAAVSVDALYVVNGAANSISVVDAALGKLIGTIMLKNAAFPHHINLSADRSQLLVAVPGMDLSGGHNGGTAGMKGAVMLLEATTGKTLMARQLDAMNHNAIFSPDGKEVWTSQMSMPGSVLVLDAMTLETKQTIAVGDMPAEVTFSKDGKYAFVANGMTNDVSVLDPATKSVVKTIPVGANPVGAWSGDDGVMYVECEQGKVVTAIDGKTLAVTRTYALGFTPGMARTTPTGSALWITDEDNGKVTFNMTTASMKMGEVITGAGAHGLVFSPDGKSAFVTNQGANTLSVIDVGTGKVTGTVNVGTKPNGIVFRSK